MPTFVASKFDPENDSDRPVVGEFLTHNDKQYKIAEVSHVMTRDLFRRTGKEVDDYKGHAEIVFRQHTTRMAVYWMVYCDLVTDQPQQESET